MSTDRDTDEFLRKLFSEPTERTAQAQAIYEALRATNNLSSHRTLTYRCGTRRRCLLLDVLTVPNGVLIASPRYKVSPAVNNETSSEGGRKKNTEDGDRRWKAQAYYAVDAINFTVNCDHVAQGTIGKADVEADLRAGNADVVWPRIQGAA